TFDLPANTITTTERSARVSVAGRRISCGIDSTASSWPVTRKKLSERPRLTLRAIQHNNVPSPAEMLDSILDYLRQPIVVLSGTPVTALTLLTALGIVIIARIVAALLGRSLERLLTRRQVDKGLRFAVTKISRWTVILLGVLVALGTIGIDMSAIMAGG